MTGREQSVILSIALILAKVYLISLLELSSDKVNQ